MIDYERYKELVPEETLEFTKILLLYLDCYNDIEIKAKSVNLFGIKKYVKDLYLFLHVLNKFDTYKTILGQGGYKDNFLILKDLKPTGEENFDELFSKYSHYFLIHKKDSNYSTLTPIELFMPIINAYYEKCNSFEAYNNIFELNCLNFIEQYLKPFAKTVKAKEQEALEKKIFDGLPLNVRSFLETASQIRKDLVANYKNNDVFQDIENDSIPLSLLLAISHYDDFEKDEYDLNMKKVIKDVLNHNNLKMSSYANAIDYNPNNYDDYPIDTSVINSYFRKYYEKGIYEGKQRKDVTVQGIVENIINQKLNDTLIIDRVMQKSHCTPDSLKNFLSQIDEFYKLDKEEKMHDYILEIYKDLSRDSIEYLELATRIYSLIQNKMSENKHNTEVLNSSDDLDTLSLFIASYYYNLDVAEFFKSYNITLDKVLNYLKLNITKEEIDNVPLDKKLLVDTFKKFVNSGVNHDEDINNITPTHINHNLCDRHFNSSSILERIFYNHTDNTFIDKDFLDQLEERIESIRRQEQSERFVFLINGLDNHTINYLKKLSKVYKALSNYDIDIDSKKTYALLLSLYSFESENTVFNIFKKHNLDLGLLYQTSPFNNALEYIKNKYDYKLDDIDADLLLNNFKNILFDKNNNRRNILEIIKSIPDCCDSLTLMDLYNKYNFNSDIFTNFNDYLIQEKKDREFEEKEKKAKELFHNGYGVYDYLTEAIRIMKYLYSTKNEKIMAGETIDVSVLLSLINSSDKQYFEQNGITLENVCRVYGISIKDLKSYETKIDYQSHIEDFHKYLDYANKEDFKKAFFDKNIVLKDIIKKLNARDSDILIDYDKLKAEVVTHKDYIDTLSLEGKIRILDSQELEPLDVDKIDSVIGFGKSLSVHSKYIYDELPKLSSENSYEKSIESIQSLITQVYDNKSEKRGGFLKLFSTKNNKIEINLDALGELKSSIDVNIKVLSEELKNYNKIRLYLDAYRKKNRIYLEKTNEFIDIIVSELNKLDPENEDDYGRFVYLKGLLQVMKDKVNRFNTTNAIAKQDLLRISQVTVNHFITINALDMAKNDLFPLIGGEFAIYKGRESERSALELSKNVMNLFKALLERNIEETAKNLELINGSNIPVELIESIDNDIDTYLSLDNAIKEGKRFLLRKENRRNRDNDDYDNYVIPGNDD